MNYPGWCAKWGLSASRKRRRIVRGAAARERLFWWWWRASADSLCWVTYIIRRTALLYYWCSTGTTIYIKSICGKNRCMCCTNFLQIVEVCTKLRVEWITDYAHCDYYRHSIMLRYVRYIYNDNNAAQIACQIFCRVFYKRLISHIYYYLRSHKLHVSVFFFTNNYDGSRSSIDHRLHFLFHRHFRRNS